MILFMPTECLGPHWKDHFQNNNHYSLTHLQPTFIKYVIPAIEATKKKSGRAEIQTILRVLYSHHCFTHALDKSPTASPDNVYTCLSRMETRVFCLDRWSESKALPNIITTLQKCFFTRHHNYFVIRNTINPGLGDYFIYFRLKLSSNGNFIELNIESAYPRLDGDREKKAQQVGFNVLVVNAIRGVGTHTAR